MIHKEKWPEMSHFSSAAMHVLLLFRSDTNPFLSLSFCCLSSERKKEIEGNKVTNRSAQPGVMGAKPKCLRCPAAVLAERKPGKVVFVLVSLTRSQQLGIPRQSWEWIQLFLPFGQQQRRKGLKLSARAEPSSQNKLTNQFQSSHQSISSSYIFDYILNPFLALFSLYKQDWMTVSGYWAPQPSRTTNVLAKL